jgi:anaerobic selenocysteine-containing dehydrogenase
VPWQRLRAAASGLVDAAAPGPGWLVPRLLPNGQLDLCPQPLAAQLAQWWAADGGTESGDVTLLNRRLPRQMNSTLRDTDSQRVPGPRPTLLLNQADAARLGLADGDAVEVATAAGSTAAVLEVSAAMLAGTASLPHGWATPGVNALTSTDNLDPLTGMPQLTALPVRVRRARSAPAMGGRAG